MARSVDREVGGVVFNVESRGWEEVSSGGEEGPRVVVKPLWIKLWTPILF